MGILVPIQTHQGEQFPDPPAQFLLFPPLQRWNQGYISLHRKMGKQTHVLDHIPDAPAQLNGIPGGGRAVLDKDFSVGGFKQPVDQLQGRGLPAAASPNQHHGLTLADLKIQMGKDFSFCQLIGDLTKLNGDFRLLHFACSHSKCSVAILLASFKLILPVPKTGNSSTFRNLSLRGIKRLGNPISPNFLRISGMVSSS